MVGGNIMTNLMSRKVTYSNSIFNKMSEEEIKEYQFFLLIEQLKYVYRNSVYYREKFDEANINIADIKSFDDYFKLPLFLDKEKERLSQQESRERLGHPFGMHLASSPDEIAFTGTTSGTSGQPTFTYTFTHEDLKLMNQFISHMLSYGRIMKGERVFLGMRLEFMLRLRLLMG